ncbi:hypothetical protein G6F31_020630 [Rhizopus arrhizus]|nr:hypothetical protein G6F31_020630 [Rhizopus arrhizus]
MSATIGAAKLARALPIAASIACGRPPVPWNANCAAMRTAQTCSAITLICCCTAWKRPMGLPNCARVLA